MVEVKHHPWYAMLPVKVIMLVSFTLIAWFDRRERRQRKARGASE